MGRKISNVLKGEVVSSIFYIVLGLCLILIPDQTVNIICKVIFGLIMIAAGVYHIGIYVAEREKATILDLFTGVITMVLGVFLFFTPQIVIKILPYLLGAFVLVDSFWKLKGTHRLRKASLGMWKVFLIGSLIFILMGIAVMFYPFISVTKMILFCGCILTANGVLDLVFLIMLKVGLRKAEKHRQQEEENRSTDSDCTDSDCADAERVENTEKVMIGEKDLSGDKTVVSSEFTKNDLEMETEKTAEAADAENILETKEEWSEDTADMESPNREIQEMLKNHEESLEEWKD